MSLILNKKFLPAALGHLMVDVLNGTRSLLMVYFSVQLGFSNSVLGLLSMIFMVASALMQPLFGFVADKIGTRWVLTGGVLWMGIFYSLALFLPGWSAVTLLMVGSMGSGAFHSAGAMQATLVGRTEMKGRETTAASAFFIFGELAFFIGPLLGGFILQNWDRAGLFSLSVFSLPVGIYTANALRQRTAVIQPVTPPPVEVPQKRLLAGGALVLTSLFVVALAESWSAQNIGTFFPKYMADLNQPVSYYGLLMALFNLGSAAGNLTGGVLSDRIGRYKVIMLGMLLAAGPLVLMGLVGASPLLYIIMPVAGALKGMMYSAIVVTAQRSIPGGMGLASGLVLGFLFSSGAVGGLITGGIADRWGFLPVFYMTAGLVLLGAFAARGLKYAR